MPCGLALNIIMFEMQMSQYAYDSEGQKDWGVHGDPNTKRSLKCFHLDRVCD